jgi:hypothetical protein
LFALPYFLGPSDMLLQTPLCILEDIFQTFANFLIHHNILACLKKCMAKTSSLQTFLQTQYPTTYNKFKWCSHNNKNKPLILHTCNKFLLQVTFFQ